MVVLRRLDALEPTKEAVMEELPSKGGSGFYRMGRSGLRDASGYVFYNTSEWTLQRLCTTRPPTASKYCKPTLKII
jgi:type I restriction enzyme M protein